MHYHSTARRTKKVYTSKWTGVIDIVVMDEDHRLRRPSIKFFASIKQLEANVHWVMTATPAINDSTVIILYRYKENNADQEH